MRRLVGNNSPCNIPDIAITNTLRLCLGDTPETPCLPMSIRITRGSSREHVRCVYSKRLWGRQRRAMVRLGHPTR
jgi:hypothetical protein